MNELHIDMRNKKRKTHRILSNGNVPGVVYGPNMNSVPVKMKQTELMKALQNAGEVYDVEFHGNHFMAKVDEIQTHPVSNELIHFSLIHLDQHKESEVEVPVRFKGTPIGVRKGGVLVIVKDELAVQATPSKIPSKLSADISSLDIGEKLTVNDITIPEDVEMNQTDSSEVIAVCNPPVRAVPVLSDEVIEENTKQDDSNSLIANAI